MPVEYLTGQNARDWASDNNSKVYTDTYGEPVYVDPFDRDVPLQSIFIPVNAFSFESKQDLIDSLSEEVLRFKGDLSAKEAYESFFLSSQVYIQDGKWLLLEMTPALWDELLQQALDWRNSNEAV